MVCGEEDLVEIEELLGRLSNVDRSGVLLMPQAMSKTSHRERGPLVAQLCREHGFRYCPRVQIELWGNKRGT